MSVRVLVIPEDPTHNGYILRPLAEIVLADAGKPSAKITVLSNPKLGGYDEAVAAVRNELASRYSFMDLWLFFPDADRANAAAMSDLEAHLGRQGVNLLCCPAEPEVEIYACAAYRTEIDMDWNTVVRTHPQFKERVFKPLLAKHGDARSPGGGRTQMTRRSVNSPNRFFRLCPEVRRLRDRIAGLLTN